MKLVIKQSTANGLTDLPTTKAGAAAAAAAVAAAAVAAAAVGVKLTCTFFNFRCTIEIILGSSCKSRGTEIYLWTDPACFFCYYYCSTADTTSTATYSGLTNVDIN